MDTVLNKLQEMFNVVSIIESLIGWIPSLLSAIVTMIVFWGLWRAARFGAILVIRQSKLDATLAEFIQTTLKFVLLTIGVVSSLGQLGIDTTSMLTSLGVAGLTIGFAARDALSNMISGIFIFWDRPFVLGDLVEVGGEYGRVESITLRSTRVVTVDGRMLAVPNSEVVNKTVASYTNFPHLRLDISFTVAVTESLQKVRKTALAVCQGDDQLMLDPPPVVVVTALNDYNVAMQLQAWLRDEKTHTTARFALREKLFEALRDGGVEMPYETFALTPVELRGAALSTTERQQDSGRV
jgi:small conductance mechanosensitive channel